MTKKELVEQCITEYGQSVYSFCLHMTRSKTEAEDLYQDTFLLLMEKWKSLDMGQNPKSYLLALAFNLWRNKRRKQRIRDLLAGRTLSLDDADREGCSFADSLADGAKTPEELSIEKEAYQKIQDAVARLPDKYREVILLYYGTDLKQSEIARVLQIPEGTVKSRLSAAKGKLKNGIAGYGGIL